MLTDEQIFDLAEPFGAFEYGDAQGDKRRGFARAIESAATAPLLAQIAALDVQLAEARKDAERYRWLKNGCNDKGTTATHIAKDLFGFEWNRSIDAAMAQEQP